MVWSVLQWCHNTQHSDTQNKDTHPPSRTLITLTLCIIMLKDARSSVFVLTDKMQSVMLSAVMLSVVLVIVIQPNILAPGIAINKFICTMYKYK